MGKGLAAGAWKSFVNECRTDENSIWIPEGNRRRLDKGIWSPCFLANVSAFIEPESSDISQVRWSITDLATERRRKLKLLNNRSTLTSINHYRVTLVARRVTSKVLRLLSWKIPCDTICQKMQTVSSRDRRKKNLRVPEKIGARVSISNEFRWLKTWNFLPGKSRVSG